MAIRAKGSIIMLARVSKRKKSTQDFTDKVLKFSGHAGEVQEIMARNWPGPERSPNVMSATDRKRIMRSLGREC